MPSNLLDADSRFPSLDKSKSVDERFFEVKNYLYMLMEQLRYTLGHLGSENFNQTEVINWLKDEGVTDEEELLNDITPIIQEVILPSTIEPTVTTIVLQETPTIINNTVPNITNTIINNTVPDITTNIINNSVPNITTNIVNEQYITEQLGREYGVIADLTVDRLRTDYLRAYKYLQGDTSDINYLSIHDEVIEFRTASVSSTTPVQLTWDQRAYYWTDANHSGMTYRTVTQWPVYVYQYAEYVKARFSFLQNGGGTYLPTLVLGAGDQNGNDKARMLKDVGGLDLLYKTGAGAEIGIKCLLSGYMDLYGLRKTTAMDFSNWDNGTFTETVDGNVTNSYSVVFDAESRPTSITDAAGHVCTITWEQEE